MTDVDEYRTSITCNWCMRELRSYKKRDGRRSYTRLVCMNCGRGQNRSVQLMDRDINAAANILLIEMTLPARPEAFRRQKKRTREDSDDATVGAVGPSSDPLEIIMVSKFTTGIPKGYGV